MEELVELDHLGADEGYKMVFRVLPGNKLLGFKGETILLDRLFTDSTFYIYTADGGSTRYGYFRCGLEGSSIEELRSKYGRQGTRNDPFLIELEPKAFYKGLEVEYGCEYGAVFRVRFWDRVFGIAETGELFPHLVLPRRSHGCYFYKKDGSGSLTGMRDRKYKLEELREITGYTGTVEDPFEMDTDEDWSKFRVTINDGEHLKPVTLMFRGQVSHHDVVLELYKEPARCLDASTSHLELKLPERYPGAKATLVLDLDETLVTSEQASHDGQLWCFSKRPGADEFLREMAGLFELCLWTGSIPVYADAVVDKLLDPERKLFSYVLSGRHKDLTRLGRDMRRVVMVDDDHNLEYHFTGLPQVWRNVIVVAPYFGDDSSDGGALGKIAGVLRGLAAEGSSVDFRKRLEAMRTEEGNVLDEIEEGAYSGTTLDEIRRDRVKYRGAKKRGLKP